MENMIIEEVHISQVVAGDSIVCSDGHVRTICPKDIRRGGFCGDTIFGFSYNSGKIKVNRAKFKVPTNKGVVYR